MKPLDLALLRELCRTWEWLNTSHFRNAMKFPVLDWSESARQLGSWDASTRTLTLSSALLREHPWVEIVEVLKHEMAHQYVDEVLRVRDETAHGPAFQSVCERLGIDPAASGLPRAVSGDQESRVFTKIQRLLALADSPNEHEAQAAMAAAHRLMRKHNVDYAGAPRHHVFRQVGPAKTRAEAWEKILAGILAEHFFVQAIWVPAFVVAMGRPGRVLELCGTPANLDIAGYVHGYLVETSERLWRDHRRDNGIPGDRDRRRYLAGVMQGFYEQLEAQARKCSEEGLVWVGDPTLDEYVSRRHPHLRSVRASVVASDAWHSGREAGREIVLRKPVTADSTSRGRLIG